MLVQLREEALETAELADTGKSSEEYVCQALVARLRLDQQMIDGPCHHEVKKMEAR